MKRASHSYKYASTIEPISLSGQESMKKISCNLYWITVAKAGRTPASVSHHREAQAACVGF